MMRIYDARNRIPILAGISALYILYPATASACSINEKIDSRIIVKDIRQTLAQGGILALGKIKEPASPGSDIATFEADTVFQGESKPVYKIGYTSSCDKLFLAGERNKVFLLVLRPTRWGWYTTPVVSNRASYEGLIRKNFIAKRGR